MNTQQLQHLYWRAGFGPRPQEVAAGLSPAKALRQLLHEARAYEPIPSATLAGFQDPLGAVMAVPPGAPAPASMGAAGPAAAPPAPASSAPPGTASPAAAAPPLAPVEVLRPRSALALRRQGLPQLRRADLTPAQRKLQNESIRASFISMSTAWMDKMATSPGQLREKVALFWHGHFACRTRRPDDSLALLNTIREKALGKFPDLLLAVSREPAMLQFLNNQQNRKEHPNENFAREVMELFTLGRGNYTENDVKEAARAFTGWGYDAQSRFVFRERQHDAGPKTLLGQTGSWGGEDALRIILEQPAAATFIVTKMYRFFVNDVPDPAHIAPLAAAFRKSGYDVSDLLERMFSADWFYAPQNTGSLIKSPVALVAGLRRTLNLEVANDKQLLGYQKALGQTLFMPPNVAGWPGGRAWIDSSSLLLRLQLPSILFKNAEFAVRLKDDENDITPQTTGKERLVKNTETTHLPLAPIQQLLGPAPADKQPALLANFLLQAPLRPENLTLVQQVAAKADTPEARLRATLVSLLSLPEYQLA
ncbi:DUF1800 domain-containing protein [Hymenobacter cheonanensis]|uniref:DUF1800 domain-containing protein n=1 Tax=Hymenobacter sp. CA2-7 TaxID=3063993 RepID=UPI00271276A8|nr:DUF1800 domain-containing protein [Hymenobacter sp. CA2-7]MDO7884491.1 DUF1800 domain-containing protein [Hymenobacter sp. CA2-7]